MSCQVDLIYNPFSQAARLTVNRQEFTRQGSKLRKMIIDKPMSDWLEPVTRGYHQWNGFLPELIAEINEIAVTLVFRGNREDFLRFSAAVNRQAETLTESGFEPVCVTLAHIEQYSLRQLRERMIALRRDWEVSMPNQSLLLARDRLDSRLEADAGGEGTLTLIEDYVDLIRQVQRAAPAGDRPRLAEMRRSWEALTEREVRV